MFCAWLPNWSRFNPDQARYSVAGSFFQKGSPDMTQPPGRVASARNRSVHLEDLEFGSRNAARGLRPQIRHAEWGDVDRDTVEALAGRSAEAFGHPDDELTLARRDVEHARLLPEVEQADQLVELAGAGRIADHVVAMRDVEELPGVHRLPCRLSIVPQVRYQGGTHPFSVAVASVWLWTMQSMRGLAG